MSQSAQKGRVDVVRGIATNSGPPEVAIPAELLRKWQRLVDLLANIVQVPSAVLCKLEPPHYTHYSVLSSSDSEGNPFPAEQVFSMDIGTFCEAVIKSREPLLVGNAREEDRWKSAPELQVGMVSYLGYPVVWPDGHMFGTICVLDTKTNYYSELYRELLSQCRDVLQADLQTLLRLGSELEEERVHLSELFARVPQAVVLIDREFRIARVNPEFARIFGYTKEESIGARIAELMAPDDLRAEVEGFLQRMAQTPEAFAAETYVRRTDGTRVPVSLLCVPVPSTASQNVGYLIYHDLTEARRLQDEQRRHHETQLELAHANRVSTLGQLSASIAHELNQPLTGIITNSGACIRMLASDSPNVEGAKESVRRTMRDATRASEVITRLRALFSKKEPALELVDLNEVTREVIAMSLSELRSNRAIVKINLADDLPRLQADRVQLQQVVMNLLRNAGDAMSTVDDRPREVVIRTEREESGSVRLSVRDAGVGFDPHFAEKLFEAFYSTKDDGMGVGLAVSRSIIESHEGRLWATLNDGPGATFAFSIPGRALSDAH